MANSKEESNVAETVSKEPQTSDLLKTEAIFSSVLKCLKKNMDKKLKTNRKKN